MRSPSLPCRVGGAIAIRRNGFTREMHVEKTEYCKEQGRKPSLMRLAMECVFRRSGKIAFCVGLSAIFAMTSSCRRKMIEQETPHVDNSNTSAKGPGTDLAAEIVVSPNTLCRGLSGDAESKCLCPSPLQYTLSSQPKSPDHMFSTDIDVRKSASPMRRIRVFSWGDIDRVNGFLGVPSDTTSLIFTERMDSDPSSVIVVSSAPKDEFKLNVYTSEALRLKCVDQER